MALIRAFLTCAPLVRVSSFLVAIILCAGSGGAYANNCQEWLDVANESERLAARQAGNEREAARFRAHAHNMRIGYNHCMNQASQQAAPSGYSGPSGNQKLDALGNVFGDLAGMAAIMAQKRQREEAEARRRALEAEMQRREWERQQAMQASEQRGMSAAQRLREAAKARRAAAAKACVEQQSQRVEQFVAGAQICLVNTRLIASYDHEPYIEPGADPNTRGRLTPPRWRISGTRASPVCNLPLKVDTQYESFAECTRVYMCAAQAAQCTAETVARSGGDCNKTAETCLSRFPVPVNLAAGETLPPHISRPSWNAPKAKPSDQGGISGPSGRGGRSIPSTSAK